MGSGVSIFTLNLEINKGVEKNITKTTKNNKKFFIENYILIVIY